MKKTVHTSCPSYGFYMRSKKDGPSILNLHWGLNEWTITHKQALISPKLCKMRNIMGDVVEELVNRTYGLRLFTRPGWEQSTLMVHYGAVLPDSCSDPISKMGFEKFIRAPWQSYEFAGRTYHNLGMTEVGDNPIAYDIDLRYCGGSLSPEFKTRFTISTMRWHRGSGYFSFLKYFLPDLKRTGIELNHIPGINLSKRGTDRLVQCHDIPMEDACPCPLSTIRGWSESVGIICDPNTVSVAKSINFEKADWDELK